MNNSILHPVITQEKLNKAVRRIQKTVVERAGHCKLSDIQEGLAKACGVTSWNALCATLDNTAAGKGDHPSISGPLDKSAGGNSEQERTILNRFSALFVTTNQATARLKLNSDMQARLEAHRDELAYWPTFHHKNGKTTPACLHGVTIGKLLDTMADLWERKLVTLDENRLGVALGFFSLLLKENSLLIHKEAETTGKEFRHLDIGRLFPGTEKETLESIIKQIDYLFFDRLHELVPIQGHPLPLTLAVLYRNWLPSQPADSLTPEAQVDQLLVELDSEMPARCTRRSVGHHCEINCAGGLDRATVKQLSDRLGEKIKVYHSLEWVPYIDLLP